MSSWERDWKPSAGASWGSPSLAFPLLAPPFPGPCCWDWPLVVGMQRAGPLGLGLLLAWGLQRVELAWTGISAEQAFVGMPAQLYCYHISPGPRHVGSICEVSADCEGLGQKISATGAWQAASLVDDHFSGTAGLYITPFLLHSKCRSLEMESSLLVNRTPYLSIDVEASTLGGALAV